MFVEVKSVTLADGGAGRFPDAVSARAARHCDELAALARAGQRGAIVFVAQRGDVESVSPEDDVDPAFGVALRRPQRRACWCWPARSTSRLPAPPAPGACP